MKEISVDRNLIAYCGLYCGACKKYLKEKCPGCLKNEKASWCKVRRCCINNGLSSCAECTQYEDVNDCRWYNNLIARLFGFVLRSDRRACVLRIKEIGTESFAAEMAEKGLVTIRR